MTLPCGCTPSLQEWFPCLAHALFRHKTTTGLCFSFSILSTVICCGCVQGHSHQVAWNNHRVGNPSLQ